MKQFKALSELRKNWLYPPALPSLGCNVPIMKLLEMTREHLRSKLGIQQTPLSYVTMSTVNHPAIELVQTDKPFSANHEGFHNELIA